MFARVTWSQSTSPQQVETDTAVGFYRERILPSLQTQAGFLGAVLMVDPDSGEGASVTYWESAEAMSASEDMGMAGRVEVAKNFGIVVTDIDRFELLLQDRAAPPQADTFVRANDLKASRERIDATVGLIRESLPQIRSLSGYRAVLLFANRETGRMLVASAWDTAADREASETVISGLRQQLADAAQPQAAVRVSLYRAVLAEVSQGAVQAAAAATAV